MSHIFRTTRASLALGIALLTQSAAIADAQSASPGQAVARVPLASDITLDIPGNSRLAGMAEGIDSVRARLRTMGLDTPDAPLRWEQFVLSDVDQVWFIASSPRESNHAEQPLLLVARRDSVRGVVALRVIPQNQSAFDKRHARDDGIVRTSLAAQRNRRQVLALHAGNGKVRFVGADANDAWVVVDDPSTLRPAPLLLHYRFDAAGYLIDVRRATTGSTVHAVLWGPP
ncbi:MAG: hypothetical protein IBJ03_17615 [Gemmatimonadaceae bacterium]|nr:hypothetical protein [Gemmatimonadaceae bacterium]